MTLISKYDMSISVNTCLPPPFIQVLVPVYVYHHHHHHHHHHLHMVPPKLDGHAHLIKNDHYITINLSTTILSYFPSLFIKLASIIITITTTILTATTTITIILTDSPSL